MKIILFEEALVWVAACLDFNIAGQGKTPHEALDSCLYMLEGTSVLYEELNVGLPQPGRPIWKTWFAAGQHFGTIPASKLLPEIIVRQLDQTI